LQEVPCFGVIFFSLFAQKSRLLENPTKTLFMEMKTVLCL